MPACLKAYETPHPTSLRCVPAEELRARLGGRLSACGSSRRAGSETSDGASCRHTGQTRLRLSLGYRGCLGKAVSTRQRSRPPVADGYCGVLLHAETEVPSLHHCHRRAHFSRAPDDTMGPLQERRRFPQYSSRVPDLGFRISVVDTGPLCFLPHTN